MAPSDGEHTSEEHQKYMQELNRARQMSSSKSRELGRKQGSWRKISQHLKTV